jgi:hypothetical protein
MDKLYTSNACMTSTGLAITGAAAATAKTVTSSAYRINGALYPSFTPGNITLTTAQNVAASSTLVVTVGISATGTYSLTQGTAVLNSTYSGTQIAQTGQFVDPAAGTALVGYIVIKATTTAFVGGTTALDAGTYTVTYINTPMSVLL